MKLLSRQPKQDESTSASSPARSAGGVGRTLARAALPATLVALVVASITVFFFANQRAAEDARFLSLMDRLQALSQTVAKEAVTAAGGDEGAFRRLDDAAREFDRGLATLERGNPVIPLPALPALPAVQSGLAALRDGWAPVRAQTRTVIGARAAVLNYADEMADLESLKPAVHTRIDALVAALRDAYAASGQIVAAAGMSAELERISDGMVRTRIGGDGAAGTAARFAADAARMRAVIDAFARGGDGVERVEDPRVMAALRRLDRSFATVEARVREAAGLAPRLLELQAAIGQMTQADQNTLARVAALRQAYLDGTGQRTLSATLGGALGAAAVLVLMLLGLQLNRAARIRAERERQAAAEARAREEQTRIANQANQDAILRLLDEIGDLADGDLTITATVTEDITGAIADAINFSIETLRETVSNINQSSVQMADAARRSRDTAVRLTEASGQQAEQIETAAGSIVGLSESARGVSADAERGREVATQQVTYALEGSKAVRATIDGMDSIRETIQETSKRIKRLGESSQEIGDIVGLIDDIADQTNILALNAAIQASMAGEQGRGFAVVADEVQRLAERASQATKQIEGLVKAIQTDTNEAVASMEHSTAGVVQGAELAEDAGQALVRIEMVSEELAKLVATISESAAGQTTQAGEAAAIMDAIRRITTQARSGTQETADAIGALAQLATDLRTSVAGFRLPDLAQSTIVGLPTAGEQPPAPAALAPVEHAPAAVRSA